MMADARDRGDAFLCRDFFSTSCTHYLFSRPFLAFRFLCSGFCFPVHFCKDNVS